MRFPTFPQPLRLRTINTYEIRILRARSILPEEASIVESFRDLSFRLSVVYKQLVDVLDDGDLRFRAGDKDDPVSLQAFPFPASKKTFGGLITVNQLASQAVAGRSALPESQFD